MKQFCYSCSLRKKYIQRTLLKKFMPSTIQSLNCPFFNVKLCTQKLPNWNNKACEVWKTVFGYKMNSALLTDASLQSIKLIQAYVFRMYTFFRELRWPFLPPITHKAPDVDVSLRRCMFIKSVRQPLYKKWAWSTCACLGYACDQSVCEV